LRNELELLQAQSRPGETPAPSLFWSTQGKRTLLQ
jgi:hypothetical protein